MDEIPPEIERQMEIKPVPPLPEFEGLLTLEQIKNFNEADRILVAGMNVCKQIGMATYKELQASIEQSRRREAKTLIQINKIKKACLWFAGIVTVAFVGAYFNHIFK